MKKPLIFVLALIATLFLGSAATLAISSTTSFKTNQAPQNLVAVNSDLTTGNIKKITSEKSNTYVITDATGVTNKTFIGNNLAENEILPVEMEIRYYLDGTELPADELSGNSGHIKIIYSFSATSTYQNKFVPFLTITGLNLDGTRFSNIKIDNGKIISESDNITLLGYTFAGLNQNFNTDLLPDSFTVEADTTDFELGTVYSFATNELFADIDTSKVSSIDGLIGSINKLGDGLDQIITGTNDLNNGLGALTIGIAKLQTGAANLSTGADDLVAGASKLSDGLDSIVAFDNEMLAKAYGMVNQVTTAAEDIIVKYNLDPALVAELTAPIVEYYNKADAAITTYTGNIEALAKGANELSVGAANLAAGTAELKAGIDNLAVGANQLAAGGQTLQSGLTAFKTQGINKLVNFANQDLNTFLYNFRQTITAAQNYKTHTKLIFKTPSVK